jgi:HAD superfamily hydrolase (TIGR01450 family)
MGFDADESEIFSAADVTAMFLLNNHKDAKVYVVGTPALENTFREYGINLTDGTEGDIVVTSFDTTLTYEKLTNACTFIREGAEYLSTHPDYNCPTETGFIPDSGAIAAAVTASTGATPTYFGKPYRETVEMISEITGVAREDMCIFGDRLYTDIATGKKHGITAVLVLSGETKQADVAAAQPEERPDMIFGDLGDVDALMFG